MAGLCTAHVTSHILDLTKMKIFLSYYALLCSGKGVKFSNFCILRIMGCQNGSQNLLSKFSSLFARTEQAEKWEAICTGASASNSMARASHTELQRNRIQSLWKICADSVASCIINDLCNSQISLSESPPGILPPVVSNSIWTRLEYSVKFPFTVKVTYESHWCNTYTKEWSSEWFLFGKGSWWPHCAAAKGLSFNLWVIWWFGQWYHWKSLWENWDFTHLCFQLLI